MITTSNIVKSALKWVDTPYHHHARVLGVGVDCAHLIAGVALDVGYINEQQARDIPNYPVEWHLHNREEKLLQYLEAFGLQHVEKDDLQPGDVLTFQFGRTSSHLAIYIGDQRMIHACMSSGKVVVITLGGSWIERWAHTYRVPGVING